MLIQGHIFLVFVLLAIGATVLWIFISQTNTKWLAKAIVTFSVSGKTTMRMARERAPVQIIGLSPNIKTARKMQIIWGVNSCYSTKDAANATEMVNIACGIVKNKNLVQTDDSVIITAGVPFGNAGSTNLLRIAKIIDDKDLT